jgi:hypothetical protein
VLSGNKFDYSVSTSSSEGQRRGSCRAGVELTAARAKVYAGGVLLPLVLLLVFSGISQSHVARSAPRTSRGDSLETENASQTGSYQIAIGEDAMAFKKKGRFLARPKRHPLTFEKLEVRELFSISTSSLAAAEQPVDSHFTSQSISPPALQPMSPPPLKSTWTPLVYAGPDTSIQLSGTALLAGEVISNRAQGLMIGWQVVSGPGTVSFGSSNSANTTATFSAVGVYELELRATNAFASATDRVRVTVNQNVINIDQAWLDAQGDGPYYLDQSGKTYVLQTDVTTDGTAFAIIAKDVTFDLNGHTITYNNAAPITIPNGSFEQGSGTTATGWNFANAPSVTRYQGVWLNNETYDGVYSLKFGDTKTNQHVTSTTTITLEANTTYSLSGMFRYGASGNNTNPGAKGYVRLVADNAPTAETSWNKSNNRGIQFVEGVFTTGDAPVTYTVVVGVEGHASATAPFYIDDIKIQRRGASAVVVGPTIGITEGDYPEIDRYVSSNGAAGAVIQNGTIIQGQDGGTWCHAIYYRQGFVTIQDLNITIHGANSSATYVPESDSGYAAVMRNTITSNVKTITSRDHANGAVLYAVQGKVGQNTILNGPHVGVHVAWRNIPTTVYDNTIKLKARYTNAFAIIGAPGNHVYGNTIDNGTGEYSSRGILPGSGTAAQPAKIHDNIVRVQQLANNQEYGGVQLNGVYGIQIENGRQYIELYNNDVTAYGTTYAYALRFTDGSSHIHVHHNTLRALANGTGGNASTLSAAGTRGDGLLLDDNTFITNDGLAGLMTDSPGLILRRSTIEVIDPIAEPHVFDVEWSSNAGVHTTLNWLDTTYASDSSRAYVANAITKQSPRYGHAPNSSMAVALDWTTTIHVTGAGGTPLAMVQVSIKDKNGVEVYTGQTDVNGNVAANLSEFRIQGATKSEFNNYTVTAASGGQQATAQFSADKPQTVNLQINIVQQSMVEASTENVAYELSLQEFLTRRFAVHTVTAAAAIEPFIATDAECGQRDAEFRLLLEDLTATEPTETFVGDADTPKPAVDTAFGEFPESAIETDILSNLTASSVI